MAPILLLVLWKSICAVHLFTESLLSVGLDGLTILQTLILINSPRGSGKSTVIALLERFYDASAGEVLLDGVNIKDLQLKWLRQQMGLVSQEPALFATSIKENIMYGKDDATMDEVIEAAKSSNAFNFIDELPDGFDTQVGNNYAALIILFGDHVTLVDGRCRSGKEGCRCQAARNRGSPLHERCYEIRLSCFWTKRRALWMQNQRK